MRSSNCGVKNGQTRGSDGTPLAQTDRQTDSFTLIARGDEIMTYALGNKTYRNTLFAAIVGLGVALSIFISALSYQADKDLMRAQFTEAADNRYSALKRELENNLDALESLQALHYASKEVERSEFRDFAGYILKQHTNIQAFEWSPRVPDSRREAYERAAREEGFPDFQITERIAQGKMKRSEKRKEYFPVYFVEPYKGNEIALGFDLASNPKRLEALEASGNTGKMLATARITLVQEKENQFGFIVFAPVYRKGALLNSDRERWDALEGLALGVFRVNDIVEKSTSYLKSEGVDFFIYDASAPEKERFLYAHESRTRKTPMMNKDQPETGLRDTKILEVAGRKWQIIYAATPGFIAERSSSRPWVILLAGLALTGLVAGFLYSSFRHAEQAGRAAAAIEASEKKLKALFHAVNDAIMIIDPSGRILDVNNITCERLGYSRNELLKMTPRDFDTPEYAAKVAERLSEVSWKGNAIFETAWVAHDGRIIPIEISASAIEYDGKPAFISVARDLTERKKMENELKESNIFTWQIIRSAGEGIIVYGRDLRYQVWNPYMERLTGLSSEKVIGKDPLTVFHFLLDTAVLDYIQKTLEGQLSDAVEFQYAVPETDHSGWVSHTNAQLRNARGEIIGVIATVRDITERKQAEEELKKLTHKISLILNSAGEGIYGVDLEGKVTFINPAGARMLGYEVEELFGRQSHTTWHHHNPDGTALPVEQCALNEVLKERTPCAAENVVLWKKDGTNFPAEYSSTPMFEADKLVGAVVTFRDITGQLLEEQERKKLEAQLRHAQKMEAVGTLAGGVAHDFNNILNVIIGYGVMLLDRLGDDQLSKEQLDEVLGAADRAANLTKRLLAFSRKQVVDMKPVNVNEIIAGMEKMLSRIIGEDIAFTMELTAGKLLVMADAGQIEQVLMNLVLNARDAMPKGGKLTVRTGIKEMDEKYIAAYGYGKAGTYALISVADTGRGMDTETQKKIFEPFFTTKGVGAGTGLGLSIVYGIIKQHDGYINVYSEPGKGTEFKIYLSLIEEEAAADQQIGVEPAAVKGGTETILLAEDEPALRKLMRIVLEAFGYSVIAAEDGEDAIARYVENKDKIQLVILDMIMPKKSGKEAYEEIRKIKPDIKTLFVSGYTMDTIHRKELLDEGMDFILKPVSPKDLMKKVRETLDR